jgi:hypothetical protein
MCDTPKVKPPEVPLRTRTPDLKKTKRTRIHTQYTAKYIEDVIMMLFVDPISRGTPQDPVVGSDGQVYDRTGIEQWLRECGQSIDQKHITMTNAVSPATHRYLSGHTRTHVKQFREVHDVLRTEGPLEGIVCYTAVIVTRCVVFVACGNG